MRKLWKMILEFIDYDEAEWKWRYLITCPLIGIVGGAVFIFCYTVLIIWFMW